MKTLQDRKKKVSIKAIAVVIGIIVLAVGLIYLWHENSLNELRAQMEEEQKQKELLSERVNDIKEKLKSSEEEKNSLLKQIEESLMEEKYVFDSEAIAEEIKDIGELATIEYRYTNVGTLDSSKKMTIFDTDIEVPFTGKSAVITMDGIIKVGVDVQDIKVSSNELTKTITVNLPKAKLISNELDESSLKIYDESSGIFNKISLEDSSSLRKEIKEKSEQNAKTNGVYEQARENAEKIILCIIENVPGVKDSYTVVFK